MSKHEKYVRRERKKTDRARRRASRFRHPLASPPGGSHIPHGAAALAAAAVIAAGTQAYASPVRFDNPAHGGPGHFHWAVFSPETPQLRLDVMLDAASQGAPDWTMSALLQSPDPPGSFIDGWNVPGGARVEGGGFADYFAIGHDAGDLIPTGAPWNQRAFIYYAGYGSELPEGQPTYLGVRFDLSGGYQYAWVGVVRDATALEAFAWGYETEVGVPIPAGIPEPGSLALLAFGALAVCRRRP